MEFVINKNGKFLRSWAFLLPPETHETEEPVRQNTVRTVAGGYSDLFGGDIPMITIEGTTGAGIRKFENGQYVDGYSYWLEFLEYTYHVFIDSPLDDPTNEYTMHFYNWTLRQYWDVMPSVCTWDMAVPESGVFYYQMELQALEPLTAPRTAAPGSSYDTLVGNSTFNFRSVAKSGATHNAMALTLLGLGAPYVRNAAL